MAIQNRRGNFVDFDPYKMLAGEFAYALDTEELYYCVSPGNVKRCATKEEVIEILETSQEAYDGLQQLLTELEDETVATGILNDISVLFADVADLDTRVDAHLADNATKITDINQSVQSVQTQVTNMGSGSPKDVYTTVTALQTAFPTGTTGIYVVLEDGKWYYWNGSIWTAGGVYQSTGIGEKSIIAENTSFILSKTGKNLFNKNDITIGYYVSAGTGNLATLAGHNVSNYIPITSNTSYYTNYGNRIAFYDANKAFISGVSEAQSFIAPTNATYLRIDFTDAQLATAQLEKGTKATTYQAYRKEHFLQEGFFLQNDAIKKSIVTVSRTGTADYNTIKQALDSITDASELNRYEIRVAAGIYYESITTKNYVDVIGERKDITIIDFKGNTSLDINSQGAIYATSTSILKNLWIKNQDGKYPIHSDLSSGKYNLLVENCILENLGSSINPNWNGCPYGIGLFDGQNITIKDCELIGSNIATTSGIPAILCHNTALDTSGHRSLTIENCTSKNCAYGVYLETLPGTVGQHNDCYIIGNKFGAHVADINYVDNDDTHAWTVHAYGNNIRRVINNSTYIVEESGFTRRIRALARDIHKGEVITLHNGSQFGYGIAVNTLASPLVQGVALQDIVTEEVGVIQISGVCEQVKVNGTIPISNGDTLCTYTELGIAQKGTTFPFAIATQSYSTADSNGLIRAWLIPKL